ncbi:hypothetical protein ACFRK5_32885 [Streptomyces niveus]|uniref:hypothetical protein n=1 Tax=Streptomyces niveus TaxID=193462 RepID=UPI0036839BD1
MFPPPDLWYVPAESVKKIEALAPSVGITGGRVTLLQPLKRYSELAESLGADLSARKAVEAKARFDRAEKTLREAGSREEEGRRPQGARHDRRRRADVCRRITPWSMEERYSYAGYAPVLEQLAAAVTKSRRLAR